MPALDLMPTDAPLGARVDGLDLSRPLDAETAQRLRQAFLQYSVLLLRGQTLSKADQVHLTGLFGTPVPHPTNTRDRDPEAPQICIIAHTPDDGGALGALANDEVAFHADLVFLHEPGAVSVLYCLEAPQDGGATYWTSGYAAYEALDDDTKRQITGLKARYRHRRPEYNPPVPAAHPLVCTHPESGRQTLFVSPGSAHGIEGMEAKESRPLLDRLVAHAVEDRFVWRHRWRPGDLVVWDNRCTLHRRDAFDAGARRYMRRTQTLGAPHGPSAPPQING